MNKKKEKPYKEAESEKIHGKLSYRKRKEEEQLANAEVKKIKEEYAS